MILLDTNVISEAMRPRPHAAVQAWLDEQNAVISFHEIPQSEYFRAPDGVFWVYILSLLERGYRVQ